MDSRRAKTSHQLPGALSSISSTENLCEGPSLCGNTSSNRHCDCDCLYNRPVCIPNKCTTSNVLQLERPHLHVPSICVDKSVPGQDQGGGGTCTDDSPHMAEPGVVSNPTTDASELSCSPTRNSGRTDWPKRRAPPNGHGKTSPPSRLAHIRELYCSRGLSGGVIKMLSRSWRSTTESAYASAWSSLMLGNSIVPLTQCDQQFL